MEERRRGVLPLEASGGPAPISRAAGSGQRLCSRPSLRHPCPIHSRGQSLPACGPFPVPAASLPSVPGLPHFSAQLQARLRAGPRLMSKLGSPAQATLRSSAPSSIQHWSSLRATNRSLYPAWSGGTFGAGPSLPLPHSCRSSPPTGWF